MIILTREQRIALKRKYDQTTLFMTEHGPMCSDLARPHEQATPMTYREFRRLVLPYFDSSGCVMVPWCSMWIGIEVDGFTHS